MNFLAQLSDVKALLGVTASDSDTALMFHLAGASTLAEKLIGVREGQMRRQVGIMEFPDDAGREQGTLLRLSCRPIEWVTNIYSLSSPGTDADFAAATPLVLNQDYQVNIARLGSLRRLNDVWYLGSRCNEVIYSAGWIDPATAGSTSAWTNTHAYALGDLVVQGGQVYSCISAHTSSSGNAPTQANAWGKSETAIWALVHQVPMDMQLGVIQQAIRSFQTKDTGGIAPGSMIGVGQGGSMFLESTAHPVLVEACRSWRVWP